MKNDIEIKKINLEKTKLIFGREFSGSYKNTPEYIEQVKLELASMNYTYKPLHAVSIYLSDPQNEKENLLKSFHGHLVSDRRTVDPPYELLEMGAGNYLVSTTKNSAQMNDLYGETYTYAAINKISLSQKEPPILITTADDLGKPIFSIYFKIDE